MSTLKKGAVCRVHNRTIGGRDFVEGDARLLRLVQRADGRASDGELWLVSFGKGDEAERWVYPRDVVSGRPA